MNIPKNIKIKSTPKIKTKKCNKNLWLKNYTYKSVIKYYSLCSKI